MRIIALLCFACCTLVCSGKGIGQTIVWDQEPNTSIPQVIDTELSDQTTFSTYLVSDVTFPANVILNDVTVYFTNTIGTWENDITDGRLCVFPEDYSLFDPSIDGQLVPVVVTDLGNNVLAVTAGNLQLQLNPGTYWIGLSPIASLGTQQEFRYASSDLNGEMSFCRNPGGGFGLGTDWIGVDVFSPSFQDAAITITDDGLGAAFESPNSFSVIRGNLISGTLSDLNEDDDQRMEVQPGFVLNSDEAPVWLSFDGYAVADDFPPNELLFESQAGSPGLTLTVEEYNWATRTYQAFGEESEAFNVDSTKLYYPSGHMSSDLELRIRAGWRATGFTINFPWEVRIDLVRWGFCT